MGSHPSSSTGGPPATATVGPCPWRRRVAGALRAADALDGANGLVTAGGAAVAQQERKAKLDAGRVCTVFRVGDLVLLRTKELLYAVDFG